MAGIWHFMPRQTPFSLVSTISDQSVSLSSAALFPVPARACIVEGHIQSAEFSDSSVHGILQVIHFPDVRLHEQAVAVHGLDGTHHLVAVAPVAAANHNVGAFLRKAPWSCRCRW